MYLLMSDNTLRVKACGVWGTFKKYCKLKKKLWLFSLSKKTDKIKKFLKADDIVAVKRGLFKILMDGLLISGLLYYFIGFNWKLVPSFGAGWFWLKKDGINQLSKILASINLIKIGK